MPTTVHIPRPLLARADARAKSLGISRNKLIVQALEARLQAADRWPDDLVELLSSPPDTGLQQTVDQMSEAIRRRRRNRKSAPRL
jgi:hypothetical protein